MSPILKRDVHEQLRQAKRLAQSITGSSSYNHDTEYDFERGHGDSYYPAAGPSVVTPSISNGIGIGVDKKNPVEIYTSSSHPRRGIGVRDVEVQYEGKWREETKAEGEVLEGSVEHDRWEYGVDEIVQEEDLEEEVEEEEQRSFLPQSSTINTGHNHSNYPPRIPNLPHIVSASPAVDAATRQAREEASGPTSPLADLRNLLVEATPSLVFSLVGIVFTGELLEHLARWRVFRRVDELFILVPMLGNLQGNLELCLSARLGTSANIGELDHRRTRRALLLANMTLLGLQALLIASLAGFISFLLGLLTLHRLGDGTTATASTISALSIDAGLAVGEQEWHEGYTRPGFKQLVMVLATGMGAAGLSSAVLGSFMSSAIVTCRWMGVDPDNITPPVASCLGDLLTLFILALLGSALVGVMDTPIPLIAVMLMTMAACWFTKRVLRNEWVRGVARGGWVPLIGAMCISSGTGMVLDRGVERYRGFALLAISMTGLTGSIGAIHANRLSTSLHTNTHPASHHPRPNKGLKPFQRAITLYLIAFPCEALFLGFVNWAGWIDLSLGLAGWITFGITAAISLVMSHYLTLFFWSINLDPDSYTLPIHSALVDFIGQLLLMLAYEICIVQGVDVQARDI